jgi:hypothetical protein
MNLFPYISKHIQPTDINCSSTCTCQHPTKHKRQISTIKLQVVSQIFSKTSPKDEFQPKLLTFQHSTHHATPTLSQYNDPKLPRLVTMIFQNMLPPFKNANILQNPRRNFITKLKACSSNNMTRQWWLTSQLVVIHQQLGSNYNSMIHAVYISMSLTGVPKHPKIIPKRLFPANL